MLKVEIDLEELVNGLEYQDIVELIAAYKIKHDIDMDILFAKAKEVAEEPEIEINHLIYKNETVDVIIDVFQNKPVKDNKYLRLLKEFNIVLDNGTGLMLNEVFTKFLSVEESQIDGILCYPYSNIMDLVWGTIHPAQ